MYYDKDNSLSAGRCQTPALRLVYDNNQERIQGSGIEQTYKILGCFTDRNIDFLLSREFVNKEEVLRFLEESKNFPHILSLHPPRETISKCPGPFNTSGLLQTASNVLRLSPKETMQYCQVLYQNGWITYMRTDNKKYSGIFLQDVAAFIEQKWEKKYVGDLVNLENTDKTNPHEAIRVTHLNKSTLDDKECNSKINSLYRLIWKNTIQSCMSDAKYEIIEANMSSPDSNTKYIHLIEIPVFAGWKKCDESSSIEDVQNKGRALWMYLQNIKSRVQYSKIYTQVTFRNKHSHYTESSLIKKLEDLGIGRPSTFAIFIDTILDRGYVKKTDIEGEKIVCSEFTLEKNEITDKKTEKVVGNEKQKLVIQPTGILVIEFLMKHFQSVFDYSYTRDLETKLDTICEGMAHPCDICKDCDIVLKEAIKPLNTIAKQEYKLKPSQNGEYILKFSKYGPIIEENGEKIIPVMKNITLDLEKLKRCEYSVEELENIQCRCLGTWENHPIYLKTGRFGAYLEWDENKKSCNDYDNSLSEITMDDIPHIMELKEKKNMNILRTLNRDMSVRRGKFGAYIYYKTPEMKTPQFFNIKKFKEGFLTCNANTLIQWVESTYLQ
jgi:DNA topoisomerase-1